MSLATKIPLELVKEIIAFMPAEEGSMERMRELFAIHEEVEIENIEEISDFRFWGYEIWDTDTDTWFIIEPDDYDELLYYLNILRYKDDTELFRHCFEYMMERFQNAYYTRDALEGKERIARDFVDLIKCEDEIDFYYDFEDAYYGNTYRIVKKM